MPEEEFDNFIEMLEGLFLDVYGTLPSRDLLLDFADKLLHTWPDTTVEGLLQLLKEEGITEANEENAFEFHESLYSEMSAFE